MNIEALLKLWQHLPAANRPFSPLNIDSPQHSSAGLQTAAQYEKITSFDSSEGRSLITWP
jgi:hypothetical protein